MLRLSFVLIFVATLIACGGGEDEATPSASPEPTEDTHIVSGSIVLTGSGASSYSDSCSGKGGYDDIEEGASVTAFDGEGRIVGTTRLKAGKVLGEGLFPDCIFGFRIEVKTADFYTFQISHRDGPAFSYAELVEEDWTVQLTLG